MNMVMICWGQDVCWSTFLQLWFLRVLALERESCSSWIMSDADLGFGNNMREYVIVPYEFSVKFNHFSFSDRLTFSENDEACPPGSPTQTTNDHSKLFKFSVWPQQRGGPLTTSLILLHISFGIVRIQKRTALTGRPYWLDKTHNALCCCHELLTAWAGPQQRQAALRSRQRGGIFDISPWWRLCYYSDFVHYASFQRGPTTPVASHNPIWMTNTFWLWSMDCFEKLHIACTQTEASAVIFKDGLTHARRGFIL